MLHYTAVYNACYVRVENSGLRHTFGPKREEVVGGGNCIMRNCVIPTLLGFRLESGRVLCADYGLGVRGIVVRILKV